MVVFIAAELSVAVGFEVSTKRPLVLRDDEPRIMVPEPIESVSVVLVDVLLMLELVLLGTSSLPALGHILEMP